MKLVKHTAKYAVISIFIIILSLAAQAALVPTTTYLFFNTTDNQNATGNIELLNNGNQTINIIFSAENALNLTLPASSNITANETKNFSFLLKLEPFKYAGTYVGKILAKNSNNASENATIDLTVLVNERKEIQLAQETFEIVLSKGNSITKNITIKNKGNVNITALNLVSTNNNSLIAETFSPVQLPKPGESASLNYTINVDNAANLGSYNWKIKVNASGIEKEINVTLKVTFAYCGKNATGNKLDIVLEKPDSSDDFKIGDVVEGEVTVQNEWNNVLDVVVRALLYNIDENKEVKELKVDTVELDDDEEKSLSFSFDLKSEDINPNDDYKLYVKAYEEDNEENECAEDAGKFSLDVEDHEVIINAFEITPKTVDCGDLADLEFKVVNIGKKDEKDVTVEIQSTELGIDETSEEFDLEKAGDTGNTYTVRFIKQMPEDVAAESYNLKARVFYNDHEDMYSETYPLTLNQCRSGTKKPVSMVLGEGDIKLSMLSTTIKTKPGKTFVIPISLKNTGAVKAEVEVGIANAEGIGDPGAQKTLTLIPGHATILYLEIVANKDLEEGKRSLTVNVKHNDEIIATDTATVDVIENTETSSAASGTTQDLVGNVVKNIGTMKGSSMWFLGDIILVLVAVFLVRSIFKRD